MNSGKEKERKELESGVEAFLQKGGRIQEVPTGWSGDKGVSSYGYAKRREQLGSRKSDR